MARAEVTVAIKRPAADVFACLIDIDRGTEWQAELVEAKQTSSGPFGVGTTIQEVRRFIGRQIESTVQITEFEPGRKMSFESTSGPIPIRGNHTLEPVDGGTSLNLAIEAELTGVLKMAEPMVVNTAKKQITADLAKLKELLEANS